MKKIICILILVCLGAGVVYGQMSISSFISDVSKVGTTAAPFLTIGVGARANALGGAFVSVANDVTALHWNPAGIATVDEMQLALIHSDWIADLKHDYVGVALPLGTAGTIGFSVNALTMDELMVRTPLFPEGNGDIMECYDLALGLSYARGLTDRLSIGGTFKYVRSQLWHMSAQAAAFDLGIIFSNVFDFFQLGAAMTNMGTKMRFDGRDTYVYYDIRPAEAGNNEKIDAKLCTESFNLPIAFQVGVSTIIKEESNFPLLLAVDFYEPSDNVRSLNVGAEWALFNKIYLRGGYARIFEDDSERGVTLGAGYKFRIPYSRVKLYIDYCYENMGLLDNSQKYSLYIAL